MPRLAIAQLESLTPLSQSDFFRSQKADNESWEAFEERCWREKLHISKDGHVFIPPMAMKFSVTSGAKRLKRKIRGQGNATYGARFEAGFLCMDPIVLNVKAEDVAHEWINANADGVRGSGKRVRRCFPVIPEWKAEARFWLTDDAIPEDIFEEALISAGQFIGVHRFRPEKGGYYGRFKIASLRWESDAEVAQAAE